MPWFPAIAAKRAVVVESYGDEAMGLVGKDGSGSFAMRGVTLHPETRFAGATEPTRQALLAMHCEAHQHGPIARSVNAEVRCEPRWAARHETEQ